MTDKNQIIIDGVDVSKCDSYVPFGTYRGIANTRFEAGDCKYVWIGKCEGANCLFKQLAHKTKECEDLREALKEEVIYKRTYLKSLLDCKEECEKLKSESFTREELISMQEKDIERYCKALEEIEKIVKINCEEICGRKFEDCNDFLCSSKNILDIINKAKGTE